MDAQEGGGAGAEPPRGPRRGRAAKRSSTRGNGYRLDWEKADRYISKMQECGTRFILWTHTADYCGARILSPQSCDVRACRRCAKRRTGRLIEAYARQVQTFKMPALVTFTVPNVQTSAELPAALELLVKGFEKLRRRSVWPKRARGFWSLEITWSAEKGFHPHIHCVADLPWLKLRDLATTWTALTGAKHQPDVKRAGTPELKEGLVREGTKYTTKEWELEDEPLRAILAVTAGRRMFNPFGGLRAVQDERGKSGARCPGCEKVFDHDDYGREWEACSIDADEVRAVWTGPLWADLHRGWNYPQDFFSKRRKK